NRPPGRWCPFTSVGPGIRSQPACRGTPLRRGPVAARRGCSPLEHRLGMSPMQRDGSATLDRLADDRFQSFWRSAPRVAQVDFVMLATRRVTALLDEREQTANGGRLRRVGADVEDLRRETLSPALQSQLPCGRKALLAGHVGRPCLDHLGGDFEWLLD